MCVFLGSCFLDLGWSSWGLAVFQRQWPIMNSRSWAFGMRLCTMFGHDFLVKSKTLPWSTSLKAQMGWGQWGGIPPVEVTKFSVSWAAGRAAEISWCNQWYAFAVIAHMLFESSTIQEFAVKENSTGCERWLIGYNCPIGCTSYCKTHFGILYVYPIEPCTIPWQIG